MKRFYKKALIGIVGLVFLKVLVFATEKREEFLINECLIAGPAPLPFPFLTGEKDEFAPEELINFELIDPSFLWIREGDIFKWSNKDTLKWEVQNAETGIFTLNYDKSFPQIFFLFSYIRSSCWQKIPLVIETPFKIRVYIDGVPIVLKETPDNRKKCEVKLSMGVHRLFAIALAHPEIKENGYIKIIFLPQRKELISAGLTPRRAVTEDDLFNAQYLSDISLSPDGSAVAYKVNQRNPRNRKIDSWIEIRKVPGGEVERSIRDSQGIRNFQWSPNGEFFAFVVSKGKETFDLLILNRKTGEIRKILEEEKGLRDFAWSPKGDFIIFTLTEEPTEKEPKIQRVKEMEDRYHYTPYKTHLYLVLLDSQIKKRLTAGVFSPLITFRPSNPISPDGKKVVFVRNTIDLKKRPYNKNEFMILDLEDNKARNIFTSHFWYESSGWSPDGNYIYFVGSQSAGKPGLNNEEENDLYILDLEKGELKCVTEKFDPSVRAAFWANNNAIYILCNDKSYIHLYKTDKDGKSFLKIPSPVDVIKEFSISQDGKRIIFYGESLQSPPKLYFLDSGNNKTECILFPDENRWKEIVYGKVENFSFKNKRGDNIEGWIYYPVDFNPSKKYPLIVYYYGGVFPTTRSFDKRFLLYSAKGYFVYVLNPSGCIGYGREFANLHVNDWGEIVTEEIITGIKKLVKEKPFIDAQRIGAFGGSYGGFITMALAYKTNIFKTLISLYGISNITSHWGAGYWGYAYCAHSAAESFPWNRKDIYVERSPIYHADKINTPILLLHGDADVNVRYMESEQLFTALKILQREVELVRFRGEDHGLQGTDESRTALHEIMLAWWDKYLKDQPEAWQDLWKK